MNPEKWQKIKTIFNEAIELAPEDHDAFLKNHNGIDAEILAEVRNLLAAEKDDNFEQPIASLANLWQDDEPEEFVGNRIGNYKIIKEIGAGWESFSKPFAKATIFRKPPR